MFALLRFSRATRRFGSVLVKPSPPVVPKFEKRIVFQQQIELFHTSTPRRALPPFLLIVLRPVLNVVAFIGGKRFRLWWRSLPKERKDYYKSKVKEKKWKIAAAGGLLGLLGYGFYLEHLEATPITGRQRFNIITKKQLEELSEMEFEKVVAEFQGTIVHPNHPHYRRVTRVANRLLKANRHLPEIYTKNWTVTVLDDPSFNAFVLPNGSIFVFTGMLGVATSDDELGIVLGHEIAHSLLGHGGENVTTEHILSAIKILLVGLVFAIFPNDLIGLLTYIFGAEVVDTALHYPYGRLLENEADMVGLQLAAKACFDVRAAVAFWAKMQILEEQNSVQPIEWLSTHPSNKTRQEKLEEQLPEAIRTREYCDCPRLPRSDPRNEVEAFRRAVRGTKPIAVRLIVPDMSLVASEK